MGRSRNYCFTINNYTDEIVTNLREGQFKYLCIGFEESKKGTPHIQGYVEFFSGKTVSAFNNSIGCEKGKVWAHCEDRWGSAREAAGYCKKGLEPSRRGAELGNELYFESPGKGYKGFETGECSNQGRRKDLEEVIGEITAGITNADDLSIEEPMLYHQYGRTFHKAEDVVMRKRYRTNMTKGLWIWGSTGTGKSHYAHYEAAGEYNPETHYTWKSGKWQDGYTQQDTVIINEFRGNIAFSTLLQLVDKYPYTVERRNREPMPFTSKLVIITCPLHPNDVYTNRLNSDDNIAQFNRRFVIKEFTDQYRCDE